MRQFDSCLDRRRQCQCFETVLPGARDSFTGALFVCLFTLIVLSPSCTDLVVTYSYSIGLMVATTVFADDYRLTLNASNLLACFVFFFCWRTNDSFL